MKKIYFIVLLIAVIIAIILAGVFIFNKMHASNLLKNQIDSIDNFDGDIRAFSFNNSYANDMADGRGDSQYYYLKKSTLTLELWGYGREDVIDKEIDITPEEFSMLKQDVLAWIDKYDVLAMAKTELQKAAESEEHATDIHSSFSVKIYCANFDTIIMTAHSGNIDDMVRDLDEIFADYF